MANVKISALPSTTASTFNDWLVKNDSGETTTSKVQLKNVLGMTSLNGSNAIQSSSWLTNLGTTASTESAIAIGNGAEATSPYSIAIGYQAFNQNRDGGRDYYICIGYQTRAVQGGTALGKNAQALGSDATSIGQNAQTYGNGGFALGNNAFNSGNDGVAIGSNAQDNTGLGGGNQGISIGYAATSYINRSTAVGYLASASGSSAVAIGTGALAAETDAIAIGQGTQATHERSVALGYGVSTIYSSTTHTDNSYTDRTKSFRVINGGSVSGNIDVDLSLGTLFYFTLTGNTSPNFINWREGQQVQFWVDNTSSYNVPAATISGGGDVYAKAGVINPTNNQRSGYYGTIVNGDLYLDEHLNFQVV